jgi:hypothetical protein
MPGVRQEQIQIALAGYLRATRKYEWHGASAAYGNDHATSHAISRLEEVVRTQASRPELGTPSSTELHQCSRCPSKRSPCSSSSRIRASQLVST